MVPTIICVITNGKMCFFAIHNLDFPNLSDNLTNSDVCICLISALKTLASEVQCVIATPIVTPNAPPPNAIEIKIINKI